MGLRRVFTKKKQEKRTHVQSKPRRWGRVVVASVVASALLLASHVGARQYYGKAYAKKIPLVGQLVRNNNQFDFYYSTHNSASGITALEPIIKGASKSGKPYNVMLLEGANLLNSEKASKEKEFAEVASTFSNLIKVRQQVVTLSGKNGLDPKWVEAKIAQVDKIINASLSDPQLGFENARAFIAAKYGLVGKYVESYSPEELGLMKSLNQVANESKQNYLTIKPQWLALRDKRMTQTILDLEKEISTPIRAVVLVGALHEGVQARTQRQSFSRTRKVAEYFPPELTNEINQVMHDIIELKQRARSIK